MFEVTEKANEMIKEMLKDKEEIPPIRLMLSQGGWSGPSLGLALDESKEEDAVFDTNGLTFVIEQEFYDKIKPVKVDYIESAMGAGFNIESTMEKPKNSCGSCSC